MPHRETDFASVGQVKRTASINAWNPAFRTDIKAMAFAAQDEAFASARRAVTRQVRALAARAGRSVVYFWNNSGIGLFRSMLTGWTKPARPVA